MIGFLFKAKDRQVKVIKIQEILVHGPQDCKSSKAEI